MPTGESKPDVQTDAAGATADAALPDTTASAAAQTEFHRRTQQRREAACLSALRRAIDRGDYRTALKRASELATIDANWTDARLFLEDMLGGATRPAPMKPARKGAANDVTTVEPPPRPATVEEWAAPRRRTTTAVVAPAVSRSRAPRTRAVRRQVRTPLIAALALIATILAGWMLAGPAPMSTVGRWVISAGTLVADEIFPSPIPATASLDRQPVAELPPLPPAGGVPPAPLLPESGVERSGTSQPTGIAPDTSPGAASAKPLVPDVAVHTQGEIETALPAQAQRLQAPAPTPGQAAQPANGAKSQPAAPPAPRVSNPTAQIQTPAAQQRTADSRAPQTSAAPVVPPRALLPQGGTAPAAPPALRVPPNPAAQIQTAAARQKTADSRAPQTSAAPVVPRRVASPPRTSAVPVLSPRAASPPAVASARETASPNSAGVAPRPETAAPITGTGSPATSGLTEREADERAINAALGEYAQGYSALDTAAVKRVWPGASEQALSNAFAQLTSQTFLFTGCNVDVRSPYAAATCLGAARYVRRGGNGDIVNVSHLWQFSLRKRGDTWLIESANMR